MPIDILKQLYKKEITEDEASNILDSVSDRAHKDGIESIEDECSFNNYEWTASCHSASLDIISKWRYEGWPNICAECKQPLYYKYYYWIAKDNMLRHINCPKEILGSITPLC